MSAPEPNLELFELDLHGGAVEGRFRAQRPFADAMPWGSLDTAHLSEAERMAARRGWSDLALQEYGAAASQANALRLLVRARVPLDVSAMLANFPLDELAHTEICARMAEELGGPIPIVYPTDAVFPPPSLDTSSPLLQASKAVAWEFCVAETLSHGLLRFHLRHASQPLMKAVWERLAKDEALHARFGWIFLEWVKSRLDVADRRKVMAMAERAIAHVDELDAKVLSLPPEAFADVGVFGSQGREAYLIETRRVLKEEVLTRLREFV